MPRLLIVLCKLYFKYSQYCMSWGVFFVISRNKKNCHIHLSYKIIETDLKKQCLFKISHNKNVTGNISRILQNFKLILRRKSINYAKFLYSNLQLPAYIAYRSLQKITNLMIRHLTRPYFLESCGSEMLLWRVMS